MSTDLVACQKCGEQLSPYVVTCPRCGHCRRNARKRFRLRLFGDSSNTAGHVLENVYPRQSQQLPPPEPKAPVAKAPEQKPPVPPPAAVPPVSSNPKLQKPIAAPQRAEVSSKPAQAHAENKPVEEKGVAGSKPATGVPVSKAKSEIRPAAEESSSDTTSSAESPTLERPTSPSATAVERLVEVAPVRSSEPSGEVPQNKVEEPARSETKANPIRTRLPSAASAPVEPSPPAQVPVTEDEQDSATSDDASESPDQPIVSTSSEPQAAPELNPVAEVHSATPEMLPAVDPIQSKDESLYEDSAEEMESHPVETSDAPVEPVENQSDETPSLNAETTEEVAQLGEDDISESDSEQETAEEEYSEEDAAEEDLDEEFEVKTKAKNARVVLVVVLMIVGAIAIKIAVSYF